MSSGNKLFCENCNNLNEYNFQSANNMQCKLCKTTVEMNDPIIYRENVGVGSDNLEAMINSALDPTSFVEFIECGCGGKLASYNMSSNGVKHYYVCLSCKVIQLSHNMGK